MLARLGNVLYWLGTGLAGLFLAGAAWMTWTIWVELNRPGDDSGFFAFSGAALAVICWLFGRACRYVLAGR